MKLSTANKSLLLSLILTICTGCQTITINNDKTASLATTEIHKSNQYTLLFGLIPTNDNSFSPISECKETWSQLEIGHKADDILITWGLDTLLFSAASAYSGAYGLYSFYLAIGELYLQAFGGSGVVLDSQSIALSCGSDSSSS